MDINKRDVGNKIREIRKSHNLTMSDFGKIIDAPKSAVNNWEHGRNLPSKPRIVKIAMLGNTNVQWLLYGSLDEQVFKYMLNLLLNFDSNNSFLSDELDNYLDFYQDDSKFMNISSEKEEELPVYWSNDNEPINDNKTMNMRRTEALKNIASRVASKMKKDSIKNATPSVINSYMKIVFKEIENNVDVTNYGMLQFFKRNVFYLKMDMLSNFSDYKSDFKTEYKINVHLRKRLMDILDNDYNFAEKMIKEISKKDDKNDL